MAMAAMAFSAGAQDTYWALDNNHMVLTKSAFAFLTPQHANLPQYDFHQHRNVVFDHNGHLMFQGDLQGGSSMSAYSIQGLGQVVPIPTSCRKYVSIEAGPSGPPWGHYVKFRVIDASPVPGGMNPPIVSPYYGGHYQGGTSMWFGVVAAKLNSDGSRFVYHLDENLGTWSSRLERYTIDPWGNNPGAATVIVPSGLPHGNHLEIAPDGQSLGWCTRNGQFVTYNLATQALTFYNGFSWEMGDNGDVDYYKTKGIEAAVLPNGERRWFLSNSTEAGFVVESLPGSYSQISSGAKGANTCYALGQNGKLYFAYPQPGSAPGAPADIYFTYADIPAGWDVGWYSSQVANAQISVTHGSSKMYWFGNHVAGEDINSSTGVSQGAATASTLSIGNLTIASGPSNPQDIVVCTGMPLYYTPHYAGIGMNNSTMMVTATLGHWDPNDATIFIADKEGPKIEMISSEFPRDIFSDFPHLAGENGLVEIQIWLTTPCGQSFPVKFYWYMWHAEYLNRFKFNPQNGATCGWPGNPASYYLDGRNNLTFPSPANCTDGWFGATSAGIKNLHHINGNGHVTNVMNGDVVDHSILIEEVDPVSGAVITPVCSTGAAPLSGPLGSMILFSGLQSSPSNYFVTNYATITSGGGQVFRLTADFTSATCGPIRKQAYFKILPGNSMLRQSADAGQTAMQIEELPVTVFPNPVTDNLMVTWSSDADGKAEIYLVDVLGREVMRQELAEAAGTNEMKLNVSHLAPGLYHYKVKTANGTSKGTITKQ